MYLYTIPVFPHVFMHTEEHDAFCDASHLDKDPLPVTGVTNIRTGAERVIFPGKITVNDKYVCMSVGSISSFHNSNRWGASWRASATRWRSRISAPELPGTAVCLGIVWGRPIC